MRHPIYATSSQLAQLIALVTRRAKRRQRAGEPGSLEELVSAELADNRTPAIGQVLYRIRRKEAALTHANQLRVAAE
jgi:hypothetical protein